VKTDPRAEIIRAEGVTKRFKGLVAVDKVDFVLREYDVAGIIGSNGAGKTTFFNLLTGYYPPDEGRVFFKGQDVTRMPVERRVDLGMMRTFQLTATFDSLTVVDNLVLSYFRAYKKPSLLALFFKTCKGQRNEPKIVEILETFDLKDIRDRIVKNLSLGEKRRLEIAMSILAEPSLLLLDEPLAGLAESEIKMLLDVLKARLAKMDYDFEVSDAALGQVGKAGFDPVYGARPLKRAIQSEIENPLAKAILEGRFAPKDVIVVEMRDGRVAFGKSPLAQAA